MDESFLNEGKQEATEKEAMSIDTEGLKIRPSQIQMVQLLFADRLTRQSIKDSGRQTVSVGQGLTAQERLDKDILLNILTLANAASWFFLIKSENNLDELNCSRICGVIWERSFAEYALDVVYESRL